MDNNNESNEKTVVLLPPTKYTLVAQNELDGKGAIVQSLALHQDGVEKTCPFMPPVIDYETGIIKMPHRVRSSCNSRCANFKIIQEEEGPLKVLIGCGRGLEYDISNPSAIKKVD
jgi:hypothetical protein